MTTAMEKMTPQLDGWHYRDALKQGTGGHGDSSGLYGETYTKKISLLPERTSRYDTGKTVTKDDRERPVYYSSTFRAARASSLYEIENIDPSIYSAFASLGFSGNKAVLCCDLLKWQKDSEGNEIEVKKGLSFVVGDYEARLIGKKHTFLFNHKAVRSFKGKK